MVSCRRAHPMPRPVAGHGPKVTRPLRLAPLRNVHAEGAQAHSTAAVRRFIEDQRRKARKATCAWPDVVSTVDREHARRPTDFAAIRQH